MTILLAATIWIFMLLLAICLCLSAQRGDLAMTSSDSGDPHLRHSDPLVRTHIRDTRDPGQALPDPSRQAAA